MGWFGGVVAGVTSSDVSVTLFHQGEEGHSLGPSPVDGNLAFADGVGIKPVQRQIWRSATAIATASQPQIEQGDVIFRNCW